MKKKDLNFKRGGCLLLILGTIGVMLGTLCFILAITGITGQIINNRFSVPPSYAIMKLQFPLIIVAFVLFEFILVMVYLSSGDSKKTDEKSGRVPGQSLNQGIDASGKSANAKRILLIFCVGLSIGILLCGVMAVNEYTVVNQDGLSTWFFEKTSDYSWSDVSSCVVDCDNDKGLSVTFTMNDGKTFEILQGTTSTSGTFSDKYGTPTAFAAEICASLEQNGVPCNVAHFDRAVSFYKNDYPEQWPYISQLIHYREIVD